MSASELNIPRSIRDLAEVVHASGGRAWIVGGGVRDHLMGRSVKDWDVEVHGIPADRLEPLLRRHGSVNAVGRSFGVFKLRPRGSPATDPEIDVSIPRRDSNSGPGHRGIAVEGDPFMPLDEAVRRRDLTINAIMVDVRTLEIVDPAGGVDDLRAGRLRAVDATTFLDDPLRALRVAQFVARTGFSPDAALLDLCRAAPLQELPAERIQGEWEKLLVRGTHLVEGLQVARDTAILARVFPERPDPTELDRALDRARPHRDALDGIGRRWALMLGIWLSACTMEAAEATLDRLWLHKVAGFPVRVQVLAVLEHLADPAGTDAELRHLSVHAELQLSLGVRSALDPTFGEASLERAGALGILSSKPVPLLQGRDLKELGIRPGPHMGPLLAEAYRLQLDGVLDTAESARDWAAQQS
ncbi:MAG: hypothetical protein R3F61_11890 [Myxococcota bacterium]